MPIAAADLAMRLMAVSRAPFQAMAGLCRWNRRQRRMMTSLTGRPAGKVRVRGGRIRIRTRGCVLLRQGEARRPTCFPATGSRVSAIRAVQQSLLYNGIRAIPAFAEMAL